MVKACSDDLRIRVVKFVEAGASRRAAARHFGVSESSAIRWVMLYHTTGSVSAKAMGGDRRSHLIEAHGAVLLSAIEAEPDLTLCELRDLLLAERDFTASLETVRSFLKRHKMTRKKRPRTQPNRTAKTSPPPARPGGRSRGISTPNA